MKIVSLKKLKKGLEEKSDWTVNIYPLSYVSSYFSWFFVNFLPFTPNQISFIWEFVALIGFVFMSLGGYWNLVIGILFYQFAILLDYVDGQIARTTKHTTVGGAWLDYVFSWINRSLLMLALGVGLFRGTGQIIYFYLGLLTCLILLFDNLAKLKVYETLFGKDLHSLIKEFRDRMKRGGKRVQEGYFRKMKALFTELMRPFVPFSFLFWSILFGISKYYLILMAIIVPIGFIKNFISIYKDIGNIRT